MDVVERIKRLNELGVTKKTIAEGSGISQTTISNWCRGVKYPSRENEARFELWLSEWKESIISV